MLKKQFGKARENIVRQDNLLFGAHAISRAVLLLGKLNAYGLLGSSSRVE
jgi:hypothetical protein